MNVLGRLSDLLLQAVVPKVEAHASDVVVFGGCCSLRNSWQWVNGGWYCLSDRNCGT